MTRAACNLILNITKICLTYRSIKALKRSGKQCNNNDGDENDDNENNNHINTKDKIQDIETHENDLEILQTWSLIAFLTIYNVIGIETILSVFPLYYYFKMILILITAIPSTKFPNFWCEVLLIPMMQKCHELIDLDWKYILIRELIMFPWRILDVSIMPGLLCDEKTIEEVKRQRMIQIQSATYCNLKDVFRNALLYNNNKKEDDDIHITDDMILKHDEIVNLQSDLSNNSNINNNDNDDDDTIVSIPSNIPTTGIMSPSSPIARSRVAASSLHLRKFSRDHQQHQQHSNQQQTTINSRSHDNENVNCDDESSDHDTDDKYIIEFDENDNIEIHHPSKRTSLNQRLRSFITGDSNIRLRDYLFDVDLPSAPSRDSNLISPSKTFESDCDGGGGRRRESNVTIRRSRRIANKRI